jgi:predicted methyltransferase
MKLTRRGFVAAGAVALGGPVWAQTAVDATLRAAIANPKRNPKNVARDRYRKPYELLKFFGLKDTQSVLEIQPGGGYWTEILAPYLAPQGQYTAAVPDLTPHEKDLEAAYTKKLAVDPVAYGKVKVVPFGHGPLGAPNSYDLILSFRNLHDWLEQDRTTALLAEIYAALKPCGIFGIEDHRWPATEPQDPKAKNGYVSEVYAKTLIEAAGFKFVAASEIGANPKDTKDYPDGVWDLPPTLRGGAKDRAKYLAIGESDRWTFKFIKP